MTQNKNWKYQEISVEFFFMKQPYALIKGNKKVISNIKWKNKKKKTLKKETGQNYINTLISWSWAYDWDNSIKKNRCI